MTITDKDIGWGKYDGHEGPFFRGSIPYVLPAKPDFKDKVLAVLAATEGRYDAINMYDTCILSVGCIQWCERIGNYSRFLLGPCAQHDAFTLQGFLSEIDDQLTFRKNELSQWSFFRNGFEVATEQDKRQLFLGPGASGKVGTWSKDNIAYAKRVAACMASIWSNDGFRQVQVDQTKSHLVSFVPNATDLLTAFVSIEDPSDLEGWKGAYRAIYYSFAANLPAVAARSIRGAWVNPVWASADHPDQFRLAAQALTFAPNIGIYPTRYTHIAPVLAKLFNVDIPLTATALKAWKDAPPEALQVAVSSRELKMACRHTPET